MGSNSELGNRIMNFASKLVLGIVVGAVMGTVLSFYDYGQFIAPSVEAYVLFWGVFGAVLGLKPTWSA